MISRLIAAISLQFALSDGKILMGIIFQIFSVDSSECSFSVSHASCGSFASHGTHVKQSWVFASAFTEISLLCPVPIPLFFPLSPHFEDLLPFTDYTDFHC